MIYKIYADDKLLFHPLIDELKITSPKLNLEDNGIGTFSFIIYPTNPQIEAIHKLKTIIKVYQDDFLIFKGVVLEDKKLFKNQKQIKCKEDYYFLKYSVIRPYSFEGSPQKFFEFLINEHNKRVQKQHQFKIGVCTVTDKNNLIVRANSKAESCFDNIKSRLIDLLGGHIYIRHEKDGDYIDYLEDYTVVNEQSIEFGKNLLDTTSDENGLDIATAIVPYGAEVEGKRIDITSVNNGKDYIQIVDSPYGVIEYPVYFDDVTDPKNLLRKANELLESKNFFNRSIEIKAVDLGLIDNVNPFKMHQKIKVNSKYHAMDGYFTPLKMSIDLFNPKNNTITLNSVSKTLTEGQIESNKTQSQIVEQIIITNKDLTDKITSNITDVKELIKTSIETNNGDVMIEVGKQYYAKGEVDKLISDTNTSFKQDDKQIRIDINKFTTDTNNEINKVNTYFEFKDTGLLIGKKDLGAKLNLANDEASFIQDGVKASYWKHTVFYNKNGVFTDSLRVGDFGFFPQSNGKLKFKKVK